MVFMYNYFNNPDEDGNGYNDVADDSEDQGLVNAIFYKNAYASHQTDSNGDGIADIGDLSPPLPPTGMPGTHRRDMSPIMLSELGVINYNAFMKGTNE